MNKDIFEKKINALGKFKLCWGSHATDAFQDMQFELNRPHQACGDCNLMVKDRIVIVERRFEDDNTSHWRNRCKSCKKKWIKIIR